MGPRAGRHPILTRLKGGIGIARSSGLTVPGRGDVCCRAVTNKPNSVDAILFYANIALRACMCVYVCLSANRRRRHTLSSASSSSSSIYIALSLTHTLALSSRPFFLSHPFTSPLSSSRQTFTPGRRMLSISEPKPRIVSPANLAHWIPGTVCGCITRME